MRKPAGENVFVLVGLIVVLVSVIVFFGGVAYAKNTDNDRVLSGEKQQFLEYYKTDKAECHNGSCKNYLFTTYDLPAPKPGHCTVIGMNSEKAAAMWCNDGAG